MCLCKACFFKDKQFNAGYCIKNNNKRKKKTSEKGVGKV